MTGAAAGQRTEAVTLVSEVMERAVVAVRPDQPIDEVADLLLELLITCVPVVGEDGRCLGVVAESDVLGRRGRVIADIMTRDVIAVDEGARLDDAAEVLLTSRIHRLPVLREGRVVGVLSRADLLRQVRNTRWTCEWCGTPERGLRPPNACPNCGGETWRFTIERQPAPPVPGPVRPTSGKGGLEGVIAGSSALCEIDGRTGRLLYRGYDIHDLAELSTFEETAYILWRGELPSGPQLEELVDELRRDMAPPAALWQVAREAPPSGSAMDILRTQISMLGMLDAEAGDNGEDANQRKAARLVAQAGTLVAGSERICQGLEPVAPRPDLGLAANFLYMLHGREAAPQQVRAFDICLVLHAEHGMNASTFAARVTAGTLSDMHAAITSAVGALKGPLHGGANERVMDLLCEFRDPASVPQRVREMLDQKRRIMGFGHRVYRTEDPRATILREQSRKLAESDGDGRWYELTRGLERAVFEAKHLYPNVDLYSASVYTSLGFPQRLFTPLFAVSRMAGWTANVMEQHRDNRLIRPDSEYIGPPPRPYVPLDLR